MARETRVFFVTDIHGSDVCFRKLLQAVRPPKSANVLVVGGDITGKYIVPIVRTPKGRLTFDFAGEAGELYSHEVVPSFLRRLADVGAYGFVCEEDEARRFSFDRKYQAEITQKLHSERLREWVLQAEKQLQGSDCRIYMNAGNDDPFYIDQILDGSSLVDRPEGKVVRLDDHLTMISCGYSNRTPWRRTPREVEEEELSERIARMIAVVPRLDRCVFNLHCPPQDTPLDLTQRLDADLRPVMSATGPELVHVGSTAVREAIERLQPCLALHGHIHEQHSSIRLGRTVCFNPGTGYYQGSLPGVLAVFRDGELRFAGLTREAVRSSDDSYQWLRGLVSDFVGAIPFLGATMKRMLFGDPRLENIEKRLKRLEGGPDVR